MVRIVWAVDLQLRPPPKRIWIPPVGMVNVTSSDVSSCSHQLLKTNPLQLPGDAVGWVLGIAEIEVSSDQGWPLSFNTRFQLLKNKVMW